MKLSRLISSLAVVAAMGAALSFAGVARADQAGNSYNQFADLVRGSQEACGGSAQCDVSQLKLVDLFDLGQQAPIRLSVKQLAALGEIAHEQAQIWGDTILEGDYEADVFVRLDRVQGVYYGKDLVGYRISYSSKGWYVGDCNYDYEDKASLVSCHEGRIHEASFVSRDMKSWFRDDHDYAEFVD